MSVAAVFLVGALSGRSAWADNCSGLSDCSFGVKVAIVLGAIVVVVVVAALAWEFAAAAAADAAAQAAAEAAAEAAARAAAEAAARAAAEAAANAAAAAAEEAAAAAAEEAAGAAAEEAAGAAADEVGAAAADEEAAAEAEAERMRELGTDPRTGQYRPGESDAAGRLEDEIGQQVERDPSGDSDWVDPEGNTYDAVGPAPPEYFNPDQFNEAIADHLLKQGLDNVVVDISNLPAEQADLVRAFIDGLSDVEQGRIILLE